MRSVWRRGQVLAKRPVRANSRRDESLLPDGAVGGADPISEILRKYQEYCGGGIVFECDAAELRRDGYMQAAGYRIIPVNPTRRSAGREELRAVEDVPEKIEIVDIFRRAEEVAAVGKRDSRGLKAVWMQLGVENGAASERARAAGITVVEDSCILNRAPEKIAATAFLSLLPFHATFCSRRSR